MVFHINSRLLNSLGLLSAGVLLANPHLVNAQAGAPNANSLIAQNTAAPAAKPPRVQGMPTMPSTPSAPTATPSSPMPKAIDPMVKPADTLKPDAAVRNTTIIDVAASNGSFKTLIAAVKAAGLADTLSGEGPFTVFAPTDDAFAALPKGVVAELLKPENKALLVKILTYHVVQGKVMAADLKPGSVNSLQGSPIVVKFAVADAMKPKATSGKMLNDKAKTDKAPTADPTETMTDPKVSDLATPNTTAPAPTTIMVNQAKVKIADVAASNGVIHAIDQVILPPDIMQQLSRSTAPAAKSSVKPTGSQPYAPKSPAAVKPMLPLQPAVQPARPNP
jgi:uncharacterized surface protein with fasciclin (FAS1) repeats